MKHCSKCGQDKPATLEFFKADGKRKDGFGTPCRACVGARWRERYAKEPGFSTKHKIHVLKGQKENPAASLARRSAWDRRHPDKARAACARRYATVKLATPEWLTDLQKSAIKIFYYNARILTACMKKRFTVDHIVPLHGDGVTGLHVPWNLQIISLRENSSKGRSLNGV